jgi:hypothetical protein
MGSSCPGFTASGQCGLHGEFSYTTGVLNAEVRVAISRSRPLRQSDHFTTAATHDEFDTARID